MEKKILLNKIKDRIKEKYHPVNIVLYGSRARGDAKADSDWDLLILINKTLTEKEKLKIQHTLYEVELEADEIINAIIHSENEWNNPLMQVSPFYKNVKKEGIVI